MPEEATTAPETESQDTPPVAPDAASSEETPAPESTEDSQPAIDYEQRYNDLRPEYDRNNQLLAAARGEHGPELQAQALQQLGVPVEFAEEEEDDESWVDPDERIDALEQKLAQKEEAEQQAHFQQLEEAYIDSTVSDLEEKEGIKLSDKEFSFVVNQAVANRLEDGRPDLEGSIAALKEIKAAHKQEYLNSKKAPKAPVGSAGEKTIDFSDPEAKKQWMAEDLEARMSAEES